MLEITNPPGGPAPEPGRAALNKANAQHSTGPRTVEGKARSSQNARKHGLTAAQLFIAPEEREEFDEFLAGLQAGVRPQGALQQVLFDQLVSAGWNLRRTRRMEAELNASARRPMDTVNDAGLAAKFDRLARHQTRFERSFHRSLRELKALQTEAALALVLPGAFMQHVQPLASRTQITKRSQALAVADRKNGVDREFYSGADAEAAALTYAFEIHEPPPLPTAS